MAAQDPMERHLLYLIDQEKEERGERRGLEQRAGGLIAALLVAFPVAAAVVKDADLGDGVQVAGLVVLVLVIVGALVQASVVTAALGAPRRQPKVIRSAREQVRTALADDRLDDAIAAQTTIVTTMRVDNGTMVRDVRRATAWLPATLVGVLVGLSLIIAGSAGPKAGPQGPSGPRGERGPAGKPAAIPARRPRGRPGRRTP
jgi:hypothetical protein